MSRYADAGGPLSKQAVSAANIWADAASGSVYIATDRNPRRLDQNIRDTKTHEFS